MSTHNTIRKLIAATAISTAIGLTSLAGGAASADGSKQGYFEYTLENTMISGYQTSAQSVPLMYQALTSNEQINAGSAEGPAFYYNKIAFNYAATKDGR